MNAFERHIARLCPVCTATIPRRYDAGRYYLEFVRHIEQLQREDAARAGNRWRIRQKHYWRRLNIVARYQISRCHHAANDAG